jgi:hypothetical protein
MFYDYMFIYQNKLICRLHSHKLRYGRGRILAGKTPRSTRGGKHVKDTIARLENKHMTARLASMDTALEVILLGLATLHFIFLMGDTMKYPYVYSR